MATPNRAPRRTVAQMSKNIATGAPVPGANASTYQSLRKTASTSDSGAYMKQRSAGKSGVTPQSFPHTKVNK